MRSEETSSPPTEAERLQDEHSFSVPNGVDGVHGSHPGDFVRSSATNRPTRFWKPHQYSPAFI
uniref:Uncharacterized protein n=1 Tax=Timema poppense TaxID=170557 RepID=A0A7R9HBL9_TIMPO|nr:unnamed protein product [Timema poppensis]